MVRPVARMLGGQFSIFELREPRTFQTATAIINATAGALTLDPHSPVRRGDTTLPQGSGQLSALSHERVEIAKRVEDGGHELEEGILNSPVSLDFSSDLGDGSRQAQPLSDIFDLVGERRLILRTWGRSPPPPACAKPPHTCVFRSSVAGLQTEKRLDGGAEWIRTAGSACSSESSRSLSVPLSPLAPVSADGENETAESPRCR